MLEKGSYLLHIASRLLVYSIARKRGKLEKILNHLYKMNAALLSCHLVLRNDVWYGYTRNLQKEKDMRLIFSVIFGFSILFGETHATELPNRLWYQESAR